MSAEAASTPRIDEAELEALDLARFNGGRSPYPKGDRSLERTFRWPADRFRRTISEVVGATDGRVLDLLCGAGRWAVFLAEQNREVVGIDQIAGCVNVAWGLCAHFGLDNAEFHAADVSYVERFPDGSFDTVWMYSALQYVERGYALSQAYRLLRPHGTLFVGNYNSDGLMLDHLLKGIEAGAVNEGASQWALSALVHGEQGDGNPSYVTVDGAAEMCQRFGFRLERVAPDRDFYPGRKAARGKGPDDAATPRERLLADYVPTVSLVARKDPASKPVGAIKGATRELRFGLRWLARRIRSRL